MTLRCQREEGGPICTSPERERVGTLFRPVPTILFGLRRSRKGRGDLAEEGGLG